MKSIEDEIKMYDDEAKIILSTPEVASYIFKELIDEFKDIKRS